MPFILTTNAVITCVHGGHVTVVPGQTEESIQGGFVLRVSDLLGAPIIGCPQAGPGIKPCTTVLAANPGSWASTVLVAGEPALLDTFTAATDGVPPGIAAVESAGQTVVEARPG